MFARDALQQLVNAYCRAVDRADYEALRSLYHPDATDSHGSFSTGGVEQFIAQLQAAEPYVLVSQHNITTTNFVIEGDELWTCTDDELVTLATKELAAIGLVEASDVEAGYVVRMPKAYPVYDDVYRDNVQVIRRWFEENAPNVHPVGRNGMHKYNNQDHSMYTAMLTVENIHGAHHDIWAVNVEEEYHETTDGRSAVSESRPPSGPSGPGPGPSGPGPSGPSGPSAGTRTPPTGDGRPTGTGRDAPIIPRSAPRLVSPAARPGVADRARNVSG